MKDKLKQFGSLTLIAFTVMLSGLVTVNTMFAEAMSPQELEMRKMVLQMVKTSLLQSCSGVEQQQCIKLSENDCKQMMSEIVSKCIEPAIDDPSYDADGNCGELVMAQYGLTEAAAHKCGVQIDAE